MAPSSARAGDSRPHVIAITLNSEINPVSASFVSDSIKRAENDHAAALVILLDTPGGDSNSMDDIVQDELAATLPVIVYVSPQGGRAASAGVFVTMASDYAAMAPNTNIGAATPIDSSGQNLGSDLRRKVLNDAEAKIRALATTHDRNATAAQLTVRRATSYTADEAASINLVERVSPNLTALLDQINGMEHPRHQAPGDAHRKRRDRSPEHAADARAAEHPDRSQPAVPAVPGRHRRPRLRGLPPGRDPARHARRRLPDPGAVRLLGGADQLGGRGADRAWGGAAPGRGVRRPATG